MAASMRYPMRHVASFCRRYAHEIAALPARLATRSHDCWRVRGSKRALAVSLLTLLEKTFKSVSKRKKLAAEIESLSAGKLVLNK
jgi:hypothetical protein